MDSGFKAVKLRVVSPLAIRQQGELMRSDGQRWERPETVKLAF